MNHHHNPNTSIPANHLIQPRSHHGQTDSDSGSDSEMRHMPHSSSGVHNPGRKRRRGMIEKRRRDRINCSLSDLKRLVPQALEKSGSAKLEKAEILQMTVDHLKSLGSNGYDSSGRMARDYHVVGFRECAAEVSRYLVAVEGMDVQDPLRIRLMSHLQMFVAQRAAAVSGSNYYGATSGQSGWPTPASGYYGAPADPTMAAANHGFEAGFASTYMPPPIMPASSTASSSSTSSGTSTSTPAASTASAASMTYMANAHLQHHIPPAPIVHPSVLNAEDPSNTAANGNYSVNSKPYRPWGTEMAC